MGTRTVRLDQQTERTLRSLRKATGLSISQVLTKGVEALSKQTAREAGIGPYEIYKKIELGQGGWATAPARAAKDAVRAAIERKHSR